MVFANIVDYRWYCCENSWARKHATTHYNTTTLIQPKPGLTVPMHQHLAHEKIWKSSEYLSVSPNLIQNEGGCNYRRSGWTHLVHVLFCLRDIDFGELLSPEMRAQHKHTTYDLAANIVHDSEPGGGQGGTYRCHVLHKVRRVTIVMIRMLRTGKHC